MADIDGHGVPLFQLVDELRSAGRYEFCREATSREKGAPFTISQMPKDVRRSLSHVRSRAFQNSEPGIYATTYCALEHGLQALGGSEELGMDEHPAIEAIRAASRAMDGAAWPDKEIRRVIQDAAAAASYTEKLLPGGSYGKWNIRLPADTLRDLQGLAGDLGIDRSQGAVLCLMWTLANEEVELEDQRREYAGLCREFLERVRLRADIVRDLLEGRTLARRGGRKVKVGGKATGKRKGKGRTA